MNLTDTETFYALPAREAAIIRTTLLDYALEDAWNSAQENADEATDRRRLPGRRA